MKKSPIISLIMPCYNSADYIVATVNGVFKQSFSDFELIIINDGSSDSSLEYLQQLSNRYPKLRYFSQTNQGAGAARNYGISEAQGEFIAFLDADDSLHPDCLKLLYQQFQQQSDIAIAYCGWQNKGLKENRCQPYIPPDYEQTNKLETLLRTCPWPIHAALTRRNIIEENGGFNEALSSSMDYDLWLRIASKYPISRVNAVLAYYHHHDGEQITNNHQRIALNHRAIQQAFLNTHPEIIKQLGHKKVRLLTDGELLKRAYINYWDRDLLTAHALFRKSLKSLYFSAKDLQYLLPSLLPYKLYKHLLLKVDKQRKT